METPEDKSKTATGEISLDKRRLPWRASVFGTQQFTIALLGEGVKRSKIVAKTKNP